MAVTLCQGVHEIKSPTSLHLKPRFTLDYKATDRIKFWGKTKAQPCFLADMVGVLSPSLMQAVLAALHSDCRLWTLHHHLHGHHPGGNAPSGEECAWRLAGARGAPAGAPAHLHSVQQQGR